MIDEILLIDGNNVMGATADGWWRDRPRAVLRLLDRLRCYAAQTGQRVELVLDVPQSDLPEGDHDGVIVHYATRKGRDAADDRLVELLEEIEAAAVKVVTSDRLLAQHVRSAGGSTMGAGRFLEELRARGC